MDGADLQLNLLKWLTNLKTFHTIPLHKIKYFSSNYVAVNKPASTMFKLKADSGATCHYLKNEHNSFLKNLTKLSDGPHATLPNNSTIQATHSGLSNESLLSVGQFCNNNCIAIFTKHKMHILKNNKIILQGHRNFNDGLWDVQIPSVPPPPPLYQKMDLNYIITKDKSKTDLARYLHVTVFSPSITTFIKAIKKILLLGLALIL